MANDEVLSTWSSGWLLLCKTGGTKFEFYNSASKASPLGPAGAFRLTVDAQEDTLDVTDQGLALMC